MRRGNIIKLIPFFLFLISPLKAQDAKFAAGELILKLKQETNSALTFTGIALNRTGISSLDALNARYSVTEIRRLFPNLKSKQAKKQNLGVILKIKLPIELSPFDLVAAYEIDPNVEYVQPNYVRRIHGTPDDPLLPQQNALQIIQAERAWNIQLASPDIIVGVIDTGIDYGHEDLRDAIWLNAGEDLDGNGRVDSTDFNGVDDDGNGFVDDIRGWDFTDAPSFPDGGDFEQPDNDPFDENGHGTSVAGIIGASGGNGTGIAGLAYGCRIMPLRAGTALGFLEEDDVASAIVYAVDNGARIINMSFGDEVVSPLLRDVIAYAHARGCVLIASAGNSATDRIHFPSGFAETISVGATNENDVLAGFSNYGASVDLVAPGVNIFTTARFDNYRNFSGTSASAPLVSALAALILSQAPQLSNESVRGLLISSADDLGTAGWDDFYAAGRINAFEALDSPYFSLAQITSPQVNQGFADGPVQIRATARGALLAEFRLELGVGETPTDWTVLVRQENKQVIDEPLFDLDISNLQDNLYTIRLTVQNHDDTAVEDKISFFIDRTPPVIANVRQTSMLDGSRHSFLLEFDTDDICGAAIKFREKGSLSEFQEKLLRFRSHEHRINFTQNIFTGEMEFSIKAVNGAGLATIADNNGALFEADLSAPAIGGLPVDILPISFRPGFFLPTTSDFDGDGNPEIILSEYDANFNFGALKILEFENGGFVERFATEDVFIPRDWGDADGDGLLEILAARGSHSFIFEQATPNSFLFDIVWSESDKWGSKITDLDRDGAGELILRIDDTFTVWETTADNQFALVDSFPNLTAGTNFVGVPRTDVADFDGDGQLEILMGDFDGDVYIYENRGNDSYQLTWFGRMPLIDTIDYLAHGDYDGDGVPEFVVGSHSDPSLNLESNFDSRHWLFRIYKTNADNSFVPVWEQAFFGFQSPADFDGGVASGDVDNDGRPEILLSVFPDFYVVDFDESTANYEVIWHANPSRSNTTLVGNFDFDGLNDFYFNDGTAVRGHEIVSDFNGPATPTAFTGRPLDSTLIELSWQHAGSPDGFRIYRGENAATLSPLATTETPPFFDSSVAPAVTYWYVVTAIDSSRATVESRPTAPLTLRTGAKPFLEKAVYLPPDQIQLIFSEQMNASVKDQTNFDISGIGTPTSAILHRSGKETILTSAQALPPGAYTVFARNVFDLHGTPIDTLRNTAAFQVVASATAPYLVRAELQGQNRLRLTFNVAMDPPSISDPDNYKLEPEVAVQSAFLRSEDPAVAIVQLDSGAPIGPFGKDYVIRVQNVQSQDGLTIRFGEGDSAALIASSPDLSNVFVYPNPYRADSAQDFVTIAGLTAQATVRILDTSGRLLRTLEETDGNGGIEWDLRDEDGELVASGVYVFYVTGEGGEKTGKFAVVR